VARNTEGLRRGGSPGRPKGTPNRVTRDAREFFVDIVNNPDYRQSLERRARAGKLAPAVECMLWFYAYGKPVQPVQQASAVTFRWADGPDPLVERLHAARKRCAAMKAATVADTPLLTPGGGTQ
jgi:hypothetical protein